MAEEKRSYDTNEAAKILGVSKYTVRSLLAKKQLRGFRITKRLRISEEDLNKFIEGRKKDEDNRD